MLNTQFKSGVTNKKAENVVRVLNISQFELTKILYSDGILAKCDLTPTAKLFLWALCSHYNPNNESMFPSQQTVSKKLGISEKSAQRAVKELKNHGLIEYETKRVNHYTFGEKFFELVKMSGVVGQNVLKEGGQNVLLTNNKEKKEKQKEFFSFSYKGKARNAEYNNGSEKIQKSRVPNSEETKKMLLEQEKMRQTAQNPYEFNEEEAFRWLNSLPKFWLTKSKLAEFLIKKYNFSEFQPAGLNKF